MRVLIAGEYSGIVRDAYIARGHEAMSCDLLKTDKPGPHHQGNVLDIVHDGWDLMIAHPPCKYLTNAGARWFKDPSRPKNEPALRRYPHPKYPSRWQDRDDSIGFFLMLKDLPIEKIAIENSQPSGYAMSFIGKYTQKVQPWWFGSQNTKGACLWLKGLKPLEATHEKPDKVIAKCHMESPGADRWKRRSVTDQFVADAMAEQWG